jgi:hypothetical protein
MRRSLSLLLAALALGGCAQLQAVQGFSVSQNALDVARNGYNTAFLTPAANYRRLGFCATGSRWTLQHPCADRAIVTKLRQADAIVAKGFNDVQAMIRAGDNTGAQAAFTSLQTAISTAEGLVALTAPGA